MPAMPGMPAMGSPEMLQWQTMLMMQQFAAMQMAAGVAPGASFPGALQMVRPGNAGTGAGAGATGAGAAGAGTAAAKKPQDDAFSDLF